MTAIRGGRVSGHTAMETCSRSTTSCDDLINALVKAHERDAELRYPKQRVAVERAAREVDALLGADALLFAVSLYDDGVSQYFKTWVDLVLTDLRLAPGSWRTSGGSTCA